MHRGAFRAALPYESVDSSLGLVIDLRHVNPCLLRHSFKYENLHSLSKVFEQKFWFFTKDLDSGYHNVDIRGS